MTVAVAKASHLFSLSCRDPWKQIRRAVLKDNIGTQLALHLLHHPAPPLLSGIIFFFWKKAKNMFDRPFLLETRLASEAFSPGPFSPLSPSASLRRPAFLRHGTGGAGERRPRPQMWDVVPKWYHQSGLFQLGD